MLATLTSWILAVMVFLVPNASWRGTYEKTAGVIAKEALSNPLFRSSLTCRDGESEEGCSDRRNLDAAAKTAAIYVALFWFESGFNPKAEGDGACLKWEESCKEREKLECKSICVKRGPPHSFCLGQINDSNFTWLGVTRDQILQDVEACVAASARVVKKSFQVCSDKPVENRLNWYAVGKDGCQDSEKGRHRMHKAVYLYSRFQNKL